VIASRRRALSRIRGAVAGAGLCAAAAGDAHAELREAAERVAEAFRAVGATVVVDRTRFLNDDATLTVVLPDLPEGECTTFVLLGARGLGFHATAVESRDAGGSLRSGPPWNGTSAGNSRAPGNDEANPKIPSAAGALSVERCGDPPPRRWLVTSDSGRGALELVIARSSKPLPSLQLILPERTGGGVGAMSEPGPPPALAPPEKRAETTETRAHRDGAAVEARATWQAGADGAGSSEETLQPGCHAMQLFAVDPRTLRSARRARLDLDAEMRDTADDRLLARDRTDAPDALLSVCVGETTRVGVVFVGSPPNAPVIVSHYSWPLPDHLPTQWGDEVRARMAHLLLARHLVSLPSEPMQLAQGGSGVTPVPIAMEPGACYLAVVALVQGTAHAIGLRIRVGARDAVDDRGVDDSGAVVAFCAEDRKVASAQVDAHGPPLLGWGLALYRLQSGIWEVPR
jgi:hypothetical protein